MAFDRRKDDRRSQSRRAADRRSKVRRSGGPLLGASEMPDMSGRPTQEGIDQIRSGLEYEVWMLRMSSDWLGEHRDKVGQALYNAHHESFLLHAGNLTEFFFPAGPATIDSIIASDFVPDWAGHATVTHELNEVRDMARRHLARLYYAASDQPRPQLIVDVTRTLEELREAFEELLGGVGL